jgi:hypothetical protein
MDMWAGEETTEETPEETPEDSEETPEWHLMSLLKNYTVKQETMEM